MTRWGPRVSLRMKIAYKEVFIDYFLVLTGCLLLPDMADLTVPLGSIIIPCLTLGGSLAMLTPYGTEE